MIAFLRGTLVESLPNRITLDVGGVGYEILIPFSCYDQLPDIGSEVKVLTHHHVREQEELLYGFLQEDERDLFRLLTHQVSGIGPAKCLSILGGMGVDAFKSAVVSGDLSALSGIKGIGKKTAERIVFELKDKVGVAEAWEVAAGGKDVEPSSTKNDAVLALIALGFKQSEASKALAASEKAGEISPDSPTEAMVRAALQRM